MLNVSMTGIKAWASILASVHTSSEKDTEREREIENDRALLVWGLGFGVWGPGSSAFKLKQG